ncbi:S-ribosylhomocysteine lyase, partial [Acinetobacter baumannii]|nr:S-ribosylhomocysteine lyase [Acinetobacter baumannii]
MTKSNVESFELDHRLVKAPYVRVAKRERLSDDVEIIKYDLRFCQPNEEHLEMPTVHSIEHMMANFMRDYTDKLIGFAPMGCQTCFY